MISPNISSLYWINCFRLINLFLLIVFLLLLVFVALVRCAYGKAIDEFKVKYDDIKNEEERVADAGEVMGNEPSEEEMKKMEESINDKCHSNTDIATGIICVNTHKDNVARRAKSK